MDLFVQGVGIPAVRELELGPEMTIRDLIAMASELGFPKEAQQSALVFIADHDEPLNLESKLHEVEVQDGCLVHIHTCRTINVSCNYVNSKKVQKFSPNKRLHAVKDTFCREFGIDPHDHASFTLLLCQTHAEPDENTQLGALTEYPSCDACFDLVKRQNVQG